jgi:hypothetical protein
MVKFPRIALTGLSLWLLAGLIGWLLPQAPAAERIVGASRTVGLPEPLHNTDLKPFAEALAKVDLWGSKSGAAAANPVATQPIVETWTRIAVVQEKSGNFIVLSGPDNVIKTFKQGETLPDGSRLLKIQVNQITLLPAGKKRPETRHLD